MARVDPVITELLDLLSNRSYTTSELRNALGISQETLKEYLDVLKSKGITLGETQDGLTIKDVSGFNEITIQYGLQAPFSIEYHESLASTNDRAADLAADGIFDIAIIADKQTAGQGRQGRTWESPTGGVWMSLSLSPDIDSHLFPLLSLGAGVAIVQTLRDMNISAYLKWPNDVLVGDEGVRGGRKIAGILARSESHDWVVLGMGINANIPARSLPDGATSIQEVSGTVNRRSIVQNILEHFTTLRDEP
ncbi:MAG: biotin--[acetyl-CoA-carboxylase] ligase, partial [Halobacteriaceae archaeon]